MSVIMGPDNTIEKRFERMVGESQAALLRTCYLYLRDRALAEDAVQETYLKALRYLSDFRGESSEKTWLMKIAINTCRDIQRSAWFRHHDRRITPEMLPEAMEEYEQKDERITLLIAQLPQKLKEVVLLYYFQELSVIEIAKVLSISQSSVSGRLKRARERLKYEIGGANDE